MRIRCQWAQDRPGKYEDMDASQWASRSNRPAPKDGARDVDSRDGWVNELEVMGVRITADAYAIEPLTDALGGVRVTQINDDPRSGWGPGERYARVLDIRPCQPDHRLGGAINTCMSMRTFSDNPVVRDAALPDAPVEPWKAFVRPPEHAIRYGVQLDDRLYGKHVQAQTPAGWRAWADGVAADSCCPKGGQILSQRGALNRYRKPYGTKTFFHSDTTMTTTVHSASSELALLSTTSVASNLSSGNIGSNGAICFQFTNQAGEPNETPWPTGVYRCQLDVVSANIDLVFGLLNLGNADGHFARLDSGTSSDLETKQQIESAFLLSGLHLATTGAVSWASGAVSDVFEALVAGQRVAGHGNATFQLQVNDPDGFVDGPWTVAGPSSPTPGLMFGGGV